MPITEDRLDLAGDPALAQLVADTTTTSAMPPALAAATRTVLAQQVRATTSTPRAVLGRGAPAARRRRVALIAAPALAAAMAGAIVVATTGGPSTSPSVAAEPARAIAWSPVAELLPTPAQPSADVDDSLYWTTACRGENGNEAYVGRGAAAASARAVHHVLVERRAGSILCIDVAFGDGTPDQPTVVLAGLTTPEGNGQFSSTSWEHHRIEAPTGGEISVLDGDSTSVPYRGDAGNAMLYGAIGPQVSGVEVVLRSGQSVTASVHDGIWAAWWPLARGQAVGAKLVVTTAEGQRSVDATGARVPDDVPAQEASGSDLTSADADAITRKIVACLQERGYPAVLGGDAEMTDSAGRSSLYWSLPGANPDDPTYRVVNQECTAAAEKAASSPPS